MFTSLGIGTGIFLGLGVYHVEKHPPEEMS
jgi:hypothetical protein